MRNHLEIFEEIEQILNTEGLVEELLQLKTEVEASCSGSELCLTVGAKLLSLQLTNSQIKSVIGPLVKEFIAYCHYNDIYPQPLN